MHTISAPVRVTSHPSELHTLVHGDLPSRLAPSQSDIDPDPPDRSCRFVHPGSPSCTGLCGLVHLPVHAHIPEGQEAESGATRTSEGPEELQVATLPSGCSSKGQPTAATRRSKLALAGPTLETHRYKPARGTKHCKFRWKGQIPVGQEADPYGVKTASDEEKSTQDRLVLCPRNKLL